MSGLIAALTLLALPGAVAANSGQISHLATSPSPPVAGTQTAFSWTGGGDDISLLGVCKNGDHLDGVIQEDGVTEGYTYTFSSATTCDVQVWIYTYSGKSQGYQLKVAYGTLTVLASPAASRREPAHLASLSPGLEQWWLNPNNPPWCRSEDDYHYRSWAGAFTGTFTVGEYFCDRNVDYFDGQFWGGAGQGFILNITAVGTVTAASVSSPGSAFNSDGNQWEPPVTIPVAFMGSQTVGHGKNAEIRNTYAACAEPNSPVYPHGELMGAWTATVTGTFSYLSVIVISEQFNSVETPFYCPAGMLTP